MSTSVMYALLMVLAVVTIYSVLTYIKQSRHQAQRDLLIDSETTVELPLHIRTEAETAFIRSATVKDQKRRARQRKADK